MINSSGPCPSKIMLVGEAPSAEEMAAGLAFSGYSMNEVSKMLTSAGIMLSTCFKTHTLRIKPLGGDATSFIAFKQSERTVDHIPYKNKYVLPLLKEHIEMLKRDIEMCQPNVIIAFGNVAMWALTSEWSVTNWRGSLLQCDLQLALNYKPKVIPTYSPAMINRMYSWRPIMVQDLRRAKSEAQSKEITSVSYNFVIRPNYETVITILHQLLTQLDCEVKKLAVDIETKVFHIECIALAWSATEAICIPLMSKDYGDGKGNYWDLQQEASIVFALSKILTHKNCFAVGQNFTYDDQFIYKFWNFSVNLKRDTMLSQHTMFSNMQKSLAFLSSMYLPYHRYWKDEGKGDIPDLQRWRYNCEDSCKTFDIDTCQQAAIKQMGVEEINSFQQDLYNAVMRAMRKGIKIDQTKRQQFDDQVVKMIEEREAFLLEVLGYAPNIKSSKQMQDLFYQVFKQKPVISKKTGSVTCDDEALTKIASREPLLKPLVTCISELRSLGVFLSTFIRGKLSYDGRMRTEYNIGGTETYRFSSGINAFEEGLNLQNIPDGKRSTVALPNVREMFVPDPGHLFFDVDLDSADLRIVAWEAQIPEMIAMLNEGKKVYVEVMKEYFKNPAMTKHDKEYTMFKSLCHGTNYLGTAKGLAERIGLLVHEVDVVQKWYYSKFPELKVWQDFIKDQVFKRKMVKNVFGYRNYFFDRIEGTVFNQAIAWIPQSTVACIINRAMLTLHKQFPDEFKLIQFDTLMQVHDSLAGQIPEENSSFYLEAIKKAVEIELPYSNPMTIPAEVHTSKISWGHCK